jgi:hypothetical protein
VSGRDWPSWPRLAESTGTRPLASWPRKSRPIKITEPRNQKFKNYLARRTDFFLKIWLVKLLLCSIDKKVAPLALHCWLSSRQLISNLLLFKNRISQNERHHCHTSAFLSQTEEIEASVFKMMRSISGLILFGMLYNTICGADHTHALNQPSNAKTTEINYFPAYPAYLNPATEKPSAQPTFFFVDVETQTPTTSKPTYKPTKSPFNKPTRRPSRIPTTRPTKRPTRRPSRFPIVVLPTL